MNHRPLNRNERLDKLFEYVKDDRVDRVKAEISGTLIKKGVGVSVVDQVHFVLLFVPFFFKIHSPLFFGLVWFSLCC